MARDRERIRSLPLVAITMGDPAGVGPEVTVRALSALELYNACRPLIIGDAGVLAMAVELVGQPMSVRRLSTPASGQFAPGGLDVLDLANVQRNEFDLGRVSAAAGRCAVDYIRKAVELAQAGEADAIVTGPINKEAINLAGFHYIGHTEILAELAHVPHCTTMLVAGELRVTHVTRHVPLSQVATHITREKVLETIQATDAGLRVFGIGQPHLAVAALNPHSGERGLLGREESEQIQPAVESARLIGVDVEGPYPADSLFVRAARGEFDAVIAMYHDQGHIPVKLHNFEASYTVTLGLPFVRTSVDHGTAFDIAWKGHASGRSMFEAVMCAARLAQHSPVHGTKRP